MLRVKLLGLVLLFVFLTSCSEENGDSPSNPYAPPPPPPAETKIVFIMVASEMDISIYVNGNFIGRLNSADVTAQRTLQPGGHSYSFKNNASLFNSEDIPFSLSEGQTITVRLGVGDQIPWLPAAAVVNIGASDDRANSRIWFSFNFVYVRSVYSARYLSVGFFGMRGCSSSESGYCFVDAGCSTNAPLNVLGRISTTYVEENTYDGTSTWFGGGYIGYSCFLDRSAGSTYYVMAQAWLGGAPSQLNQPYISRLGPPERIVRIVFNSAGLPQIYQ